MIPKAIIKQLLAGNTSAVVSEQPIAKTNMMYLDAVDKLEKHVDVV